MLLKALFSSIVTATTVVALLPISLYAQGSPLTIQPSTGWIGIGTTTPQNKLHVAAGGMLLDNAQKLYGKNSVGSPGSLIYRGNDDKTYVGEPTFGNDLVVNPGGNVGVATSTPSSTFHVNGTLTATQKNFEIDHPLDPENRALAHSALEGPEIAVFYRGEAQLLNGETVIVLPAYFESLTLRSQRTVQLTPVGGWSPLYVDSAIDNGRFVVKTAPNGSAAQRFYWEVKAVRADLPALEVEKRKKKPGDIDWNKPVVDRARRPDRYTVDAGSAR